MGSKCLHKNPYKQEAEEIRETCSWKRRKQCDHGSRDCSDGRGKEEEEELYFTFDYLNRFLFLILSCLADKKFIFSFCDVYSNFPGIVKKFKRAYTVLRFSWEASLLLGQ